MLFHIYRNRIVDELVRLNVVYLCDGEDLLQISFSARIDRIRSYCCCALVECERSNVDYFCIVYCNIRISRRIFDERTSNVC